MDSTWWAVALSEEVTAKKPLSVDIGDWPVVLWRDAEGRARALEDRCPHRRAPLSLGCIRKEGWIQCGYHGWSYDGETGRVRDIPNLKNEQRFSPVYRAERYAVQESGGLVRISQNPDAAAPTVETVEMPLSGTVHVAVDHDRYLAALFDDPSLLLSITGVDFTTYLMSELREQNGRLIMERSCQWKRPHWPAAFSSDYPLTLISSTEPMTGETDLTLRDQDFRELLFIRLAPVPAGRGVTSIRWRAVRGSSLPGFLGRALEWLNPVKVHATVDGAALRVLKPTTSVVFDDLRHQIYPSLSAQSVA